ncbi:MAG: hypothetical protein PHN79_05055, partial [Methanoregula sp.]|nr:hypothetical protein [Methanoregula sp.]
VPEPVKYHIIASTMTMSGFLRVVQLMAGDGGSILQVLCNVWRESSCNRARQMEDASRRPVISSGCCY